MIIKPSDKGQQRSRKAPWSEHGERKDKDKEEIEQRPDVSQSPRRRSARTAKRKDASPRKVEIDIQRIGVGAPTCGGECLRLTDPASSLEVEVAFADLDAECSVLWVASNQLPLTAAVPHRPKLLSWRRVESPNLLHPATALIATSHAAPVFIEPQRAGDAQPSFWAPFRATFLDACGVFVSYR